MRWPSRRLISLVLILSCLWPLQHTTAAQELPATPDLSAVTLHPNDCSFLIQGDNDPRARLGEIACGTLNVPESWSDPDGRRIDVSYLLLKSTAAQPMADPVVFLAGGPGSSPLTSGETWATFFAGLRQDRDILFFDQRGTRLSSPLRCEAYTKLMALSLPPDVDESAGALAVPTNPTDIADADNLLQTARELYGPAAAACAHQLTEQGVDLTQYNSIASANDVVALVKALGYDEYNLYGISYGTRLALEVMRNHTASGLRSVVLDSTYPPEINTYEQLATSTHEVAKRLLSDCEHDLQCSAAYPDLEQRFIKLLSHLRVEPVISADGTPITDRDLINVMHSLTGRVEIVPYVPLLISELERGEDETYRGITSGSLLAAAPALPGTDETSIPPGGAESTPGPTSLRDISAARQFVMDLQAHLDSLPGQEAVGVPQVLIDLDAQAHDRRSLQEFINREFLGSEQAEARDTFLSAVETMTDADVQDVFMVIEQAITLEDSKIAGQSVAQYYSVECNERLPFQSFAETVANAQLLEIPDLALGKPEALAKVFAICEQWPSGHARPMEHAPVSSEVPTLILAGAYDNLTPLTWNKSAFVTLPNGILVVAPTSGHAVLTYSTCAERVGQAFIANPVAPLDTSCIADLAPKWVLPPVNVMPQDGKATPAPPGT